MSTSDRPSMCGRHYGLAACMTRPVQGSTKPHGLPLPMTSHQENGTCAGAFNRKETLRHAAELKGSSLEILYPSCALLNGPWPAQLDAQALAGRAVLDGNRDLMAITDLLHDRQPQAGAGFAGGCAAVKTLKHLGPLVRR